LNYRALELRTPANQAILRISSQVQRVSVWRSLIYVEFLTSYFFTW
jgi:hypothetical protein